MTRRCTIGKDRQHIRILRSVLVILTVMGAFEVTIIVVTTGRTVTGRTVSRTTSCVTVAHTGLQLAVVTRIRMTQSTGVVMRISYNVSTTRAIMAVRRTGRCTGYVGMIAAIMRFKVAIVVRRTVRAAVTACTTAR